MIKKSEPQYNTCLLYTSDAADERSSVDLGGRRIIKKKTNTIISLSMSDYTKYESMQEIKIYSRKPHVPISSTYWL